MIGIQKQNLQLKYNTQNFAGQTEAFTDKINHRFKQIPNNNFQMQLDHTEKAYKQLDTKHELTNRYNIPKT